MGRPRRGDDGARRRRGRRSHRRAGNRSRGGGAWCAGKLVAEAGGGACCAWTWRSCHEVKQRQQSVASSCTASGLVSPESCKECCISLPEVAQHVALTSPVQNFLRKTIVHPLPSERTRTGASPWLMHCYRARECPMMRIQKCAWKKRIPLCFCHLLTQGTVSIRMDRLSSISHLP